MKTASIDRDKVLHPVDDTDGLPSDLSDIFGRIARFEHKALTQNVEAGHHDATTIPFRRHKPQLNGVLFNFAEMPCRRGIWLNAAFWNDTSMTGLAEKEISARQHLSNWWHGKTEPISGVTEQPQDTDVETQDLSSPEQFTAVRNELWGGGFLEPGGPEATRKLFKEFNINSRQPVLDLTAGLGGTALLLVQDHNLWMNALEPNAALADQARRMVQQCNLSDRLPIEDVDLEKVSHITDNKFHLIYTRERLFAVSEKIKLLTAAAKGLRDDGRLVITDYLLSQPDGLDSEALKSWTGSEVTTPHPWTLERYTSTLEQCGLKVISCKDQTKSYCENVLHAWRRLLRSFETDGAIGEWGDALLAEGELWMKRLQALDTGDLTFCRIVARSSD